MRNAEHFENLNLHCRQMSFVQRPQIPQTASLQSLGATRKQQVMLPDQNGILRPHHVRLQTVAQFHSMVHAEQMMEIKSQPQPAVSLGSIPSTSSLHSSVASFGSHGSQSSQVSER